jgi:2-keto-4-pentenoate hydratase
MTLVDHATIDDLAARLRRAYEREEPIPPLRDELPPGDVDVAYAVQRANTDHWVGEGRRIVGRKIGLTSEVVQRQLGVDQPDFGALFDDMAVADGGTFGFGAVLQPRVEAEVAIVLARALDDPDITFDELAAAVDHLLPAIEIVGSRIAGWDITIVDTIVDNASSGMFVLGTTPVDPAGIDLAAATMTMTLDGTTVSDGSGAACLGHPYHAARWLARRMIAEGTPLQAGDVILSGALGPMRDLTPGSTAVASITGLGTVRVTRDGAPA